MRKTSAKKITKRKHKKLDHINELLNKTNNNSNIMENTPSAPKRVREVLQTSLFDNIAKTPRLSNNDSPFKLINVVDRRFERQNELVDKRFEHQEKLMRTLFEEFESRILNEFEKRIDELKRDVLYLNERVTKLETVVDDITSLKTEVQKLKTQMQRQENSKVSSDLRINGIPHNANENLNDIFKSICDLVKIPTPAVKCIYRLQNHNNKHNAYSPEAVIIAKLLSPYDKNFVLKSIASFRKNNKSPLLLGQIGININEPDKSENSNNSDRPFYVNENLTTQNHKILQASIKLKRDKKLVAAFALRGLVYIRRNGDDELVRIDNLDELQNLFRDPPQFVNTF